MTEKSPSRRRRRRAALPGADRAAIGLTPQPEPAPPGAQVDPAEHTVPGAGFARRPATEAKPWHTSLAAESPQAGVANDPPDAQEPAFGEVPPSEADEEPAPER